MKASKLTLLGMELLVDFLGNYRGSLRRIMGFPDRNYDRLFSRMEKRGWMASDNKENWRLTKAGREEVFKEYPLMEWRKKEWDGKWRVVMYDFPEEKRGQRDKLRLLLKKLGFGQWQISVWVSPHDLVQKLRVFFEENEIDDYCSVYQAKRLVGASDKDFAARVWKLDDLEAEYLLLERNLQTGKTSKREIMERLIEDPMLPRGLLPKSWPWDRLMRLVAGDTKV